MLPLKKVGLQLRVRAIIHLRSVHIGRARAVLALTLELVLAVALLAVVRPLAVVQPLAVVLPLVAELELELVVVVG